MSQQQYDLDDVEQTNEQPNLDDTTEPDDDKGDQAGISVGGTNLSLGLSKLQLLAIAAVVLLAALLYLRSQRDTSSSGREILTDDQLNGESPPDEDTNGAAPEIPETGDPKEQDKAAYDYLVQSGAMVGGEDA